MAVPTQLRCSAYLNQESGVLGLVSLISEVDGGTKVMDSGDAAPMCADGTFDATVFGQTEFYSPLIATHTATDILYGYGSALVGTLIPQLTLATFDLEKKRAEMAGVAATTAK